jgi:hypothetical protein
MVSFRLMQADALALEGAACLPELYAALERASLAPLLERPSGGDADGSAPAAKANGRAAGGSQDGAQQRQENGQATPQQQQEREHEEEDQLLGEALAASRAKAGEQVQRSEGARVARVLGGGALSQK